MKKTISDINSEMLNGQAKEAESLRQQLAEALAACKLKDELMEYALPYMTSGDSYLKDALAIQLDDSALKVWLGEPVAIMGSHGHPKHTSYILGIQEEKLYGPWIPLYAPKGMK